MAEFIVVAVNVVPAVGAATGGVIYRGDHADAAAAVAAAIVALGLTNNIKMWTAPVTGFTRVRVDVTQSFNTVAE
jgi:hypothetical protein